jgi:hypothetical protein
MFSMSALVYGCVIETLLLKQSNQLGYHRKNISSRCLITASESPILVK